MKNNIISPLFWKNSLWNVPIYDGGYCFVSHSCRNSFPVRWCTTLLLPLCYCLPGEGISWSLNRKWGVNSLVPLFSRLYTLRFLDFIFWGFAKDTACQENVESMNELCERIASPPVCVTNKMSANTCWETEYCFEVCSATNGAHTEIYWAYKTFCEGHYLKIYQLILYI
jgi:hypothetical protein